MTHPHYQVIRIIFALLSILSISAFSIPKTEVGFLGSPQLRTLSTNPIFMAAEEDGVVELADNNDTVESAKAENQAKNDANILVNGQVAPFLSQGEISEEAMEMDLSDPKQARVMFYIILSLLPVLFLIPLMLASRDFIPAEMLPPVEM